MNGSDEGRPLVTNGTYEAPWWFGIALVVGAVPLCLFVASAWRLGWLWEAWPFLVAVALLGVVLVWLLLSSELRRVEWDETGLRFTWFAGASFDVAWDEVLLVRSSSARFRGRRRAIRTVITTRNGEEIRVSARGTNYQALRAALEGRVLPSGAPYG
jgi:hypothetical protein